MVLVFNCRTIFHAFLQKKKKKERKKERKKSAVSSECCHVPQLSPSQVTGKEPRSVPPMVTGCPLPAAPQNSSPLASSAAVPEQRSRRKKGQKKKRANAKAGTSLVDPQASLTLGRASERVGAGAPGAAALLTRGLCSPATQEGSSAASTAASSEAISQLKLWRRRGQKNIWTVDHIQGTKLRMNKRRRPSYRPEDQEAFYRLLEDPIIQSFLEADIFLKVSDKYLLSMVVEYFGRVGLPGHLYNRVHFFLALYIASDMEEDNPTPKRSIFQFLLGKEHWPDLYKEFLKLKVEFFHAMGHRAWVTPELCEEIQAQNPHHWVWSRVRQCAP
uniref:Speedy protein E7 n=1 Tax=Urocitellus parryii TaxID=9999 RepID=A0A8D2HEX1_UROPR